MVFVFPPAMLLPLRHRSLGTQRGCRAHGRRSVLSPCRLEADHIRAVCKELDSKCLLSYERILWKAPDNVILSFLLSFLERTTQARSASTITFHNTRRKSPPHADMLFPGHSLCRGQPQSRAQHHLKRTSMHLQSPARGAEHPQDMHQGIPWVK